MYFMFKVPAGQMQPTIARIGKEWKEITGKVKEIFVNLPRSFITIVCIRAA